MVPIAQQATAAAIAWWIARLIGAHPEPFFAPLSAFIALNAELGNRGRNALRLMTGVAIGIISGSIYLAMLGNAWYSLALAAFTGAGIAAGLGGARIVIAQAAAGAILTVASGENSTGINRLQDALIGGGVAIVFSQFLFTPEPVQFLRRGQKVLLGILATAMENMADAASDDVEWKEERALSDMQNVRNKLTDYSNLRTRGASMARHTVTGQVRRKDALTEQKIAGRLDALVEGCLILARLVIEDEDNRGRHIRQVAELGAIIRQLADGLDDATALGEAGDRVIELYRSARKAEDVNEAILLTLRLIAVDVLRYIGVDRSRIDESLRDPELDLPVPEPPQAGLIPPAPWPRTPSR